MRQCSKVSLIGRWSLAESLSLVIVRGGGGVDIGIISTARLHKLSSRDGPVGSWVETDGVAVPEALSIFP